MPTVAVLYPASHLNAVFSSIAFDFMPSPWVTCTTKPIPERVHVNLEDAGSMFFPNVGIRIQIYTVSQPRRPRVVRVKNMTMSTMEPGTTSAGEDLYQFTRLTDRPRRPQY
jgi:hypothetical protein